QPDVRFVLLGEGAAKDELQADAARRHLTNVAFLAPLPHAQLPLAIAAADVCFAGLRPLPLFEATMPVKCYEAMACARPILLAAADGLARQIFVQEAQAAIAVQPQDASAIVAGLCYLRSHPDRARHLGQLGRAYVQAHFERDQLTSVLDAHIALAAARG